MPSFCYHLFGLTLASEIELPDLIAADPAAATDVSIGLDAQSTVDDVADDPTPIAGGFAIGIAGVARYSIRGGTEINVAPDPRAASANVRLFLLGSAMGMLLHQRGLLPLHANAVVIDDRAYAFLGRSGAGKSTLAAWFHDRGFAVLSDDVCAIRFDGQGGALISAGLPRLRLWRDALIDSGRDPDDHPASFSGDPEYDKFDVRLAHRGAAALPLAGIVALRWSEIDSLEKLSGLAAVEALIANTYRGAYVSLLGQQRDHLQACVRLSRYVPVLAFDRTKGSDQLTGQINRVLNWARARDGETDR